MDSRPDPKATPRIVALHAAIGAGWLALARTAVPALLASAYRGRSGVPPLDRWVRARFHRPLDHYLRLWDDFADSVALAVALHLGLILLARRWPGSPARGAILGLSGLFLGLAVLSGPRQDYVAYLEIWEAVGRGQDPWRISPTLGYALNAYGPLFVTLAPLARWNPLAPKLLFAASYLAGLLALARPPREPSWRWLAMALGPFFWIEIAWFGHFDVLVGLACVAAISARLRGDDVSAGLGLAAGFLLKFLPVALLPFLALDGRRVRPRLVVIGAAAMAAGMALAYAIWGPTAFRPLAFAQARGSAFASIFRFLRGPYSPTGNLDRFGLPCLAGFGLATLGACRAWRLRADASAVLAALVVTTFYRVGFLQYQVIPILLLLYWARGNVATWEGSPTLRGAAGVYVGWITTLDVLLVWGGGVLHPGDPLGWLDDVVGLPTFLLSVGLWLALALASRRAG